VITIRTWVTLAVATAGLIGTVAPPDATVTGPPAPRLVAPFVTVAVRFPPLHEAGIPPRITALAVVPEIVKSTTTPARLPHDVTFAVPAARRLLDGTTDPASARRPGIVTTIPATTTHATSRSLAAPPRKL
jgi:hypothetical protein